MALGVAFCLCSVAIYLDSVDLCSNSVGVCLTSADLLFVLGGGDHAIIGVGVGGGDVM